MNLAFLGIDTKTVRIFQEGGEDSYGNAPETLISDGAGNPCRHCLQSIPKGAGMLVLAYRPFDGLHAYAETGPIFLCEGKCKGFLKSYAVPPILKTSPDYLIKGYSVADRIVYGTGAIVAFDILEQSAEAIFSDPLVAYIHVRSSRNNCFQVRIERG